jgi:outer membrane immunogenic protein
VKKLLLSSLAGLILTTGSALAADLYTPPPVYKAAPPPPPAVSWTGCYVNGGVGYGLFDQKHYLSGPGFAIDGATNSAGQGWLGRVGAGCDYQTPLFNNRLVIGAFGDYDFADLDGTVSDLIFAGDEKETDAWAVGGRVGYLVTPALLTYFDGGYTQARFSGISLNFNEPPIAPTGLSIAANTYSGWFIGGGTEYALSGILPINGLFWRTEYRYAQYQAASLSINCASAALCGAAGPTGAFLNSQKDVQTITSGVVWRFNFGGPIATRY